MTTEPIAVMLLVTETLETLGIPYFIGGSMASAVYGVYRRMPAHHRRERVSVQQRRCGH